MWMKTRVTERLKIEYPIIQGPFGGGYSTTKLAATVSNAGGLGSIGAYQMEPVEIQETIRELRTLTTAPFAINLWIPVAGEHEQELSEDAYQTQIQRLAPYYEELGVTPPPYVRNSPTHFKEQVEALLEASPPVFSFIFGIPPHEVLEECRKRGIITMGVATSADEAVAIEAAGVDIVIASGAEAGGHRASFLRTPDESPGTLALVPQVADRVKIPIVAAGGIADGRGIAAAFALGAEGVQAGTAFLACEESDISEVYRAALRSDAGRYTALTNAFTGRYGRTLKNRFVAEMKSGETEIPPFPFQMWLTSPLRQAAAEVGNTEYLAFWSGQSAPLIRHTKAAEVMQFLVEDAGRVFERLASLR